MSVICAAKIFNIGNLQIEKALKVFETLEHRIEFVDKIKGIKIFNDSKATNPDATIKALESFEEKITLILGGKDKDMDFKPVIPYMERKILNLILIGETKEKILKMLTNHEKRFKKLPFRVFVCNDFENAVYKGLDVTKPGNVLLLSPACASFDMFRDYKDRGEKFKRIILKSKNSLR
jgi:UDP-N-acetylmuramoylalanine--D-glutamate ligase